MPTFLVCCALLAALTFVPSLYREVRYRVREYRFLRYAKRHLANVAARGESIPVVGTLVSVGEPSER